MTFQKKSTVTLAQVQEQQIDTSAKLTAFRNKRQAALLLDDSHKVDAFDAEIAALEKLSARQEERIRLLEQQAQQREAEEIARRRQQLREHFAKKLADADAAAVELQATVERMAMLYRKIITIREEAWASWPISDAHHNAAAGAIEGAALSGSAVKALLSFEFYRHTDVFLGGRPGEQRQPSLPGAVSPRIDQQQNPSAIKPFADALKQASAFAVDAMRTKLDPLRALSGEMVASIDGERSPAEQKLAALLKLQNELAADLSRESEYMEVVAELARLSNEQTGATK